MAASAFSYAQAARGQGGPPTQTPPNGTSQTEQTEAGPNAANSASLPPTSVDTADENPANSLTTAEKREVDSTSGLESDTRSESVHEKRSDSRRDDDAGRLDRPWRRNDRGTRSSSATTRSVDEQDSRKQRKGRKNKPSDKQSAESASAADQDPEKPEPPKVELSEAPIPTVNIWQQRKEAQLAKVTVPATSSAAENATSLPSISQQSQQSSQADRADLQSVAADGPLPSLNGVKPSQKSIDSARPERNGSRGSRLAGKDARDGKTEVPPPVEDASSWPTPETAIHKEKKASTTDKIERTDKEGDEQAQGKKKGGWVSFDYTPNVTFKTAMPIMRGSKPRGGAKGANGTRTTAPPTGEKTNGHPASSKATESRDRPRDSANGSNRNTSAPPVTKRPVDASVVRGEPKKPVPNAGADKIKDAAATSHSDHNPSSREGRSDRGRGNFRGRGGHHTLNSHSQHSHSAAAPSGSTYPSLATSRSQGPYSPPPRQGHGQPYMPPQQRSGRGGRGSNNYHRMSLPNGASRPPPVQTQFTPYDYPMAPMSAVPFQQSYADFSIFFPMVKSQIEYYFSIENLCKDMFMRQRMDDQGYVSLHFIASFKRVRELAKDPVLLRAACEELDEIDFVVDENGEERLRRREGWERFVLPEKERDVLARKAGPKHVTPIKNGARNFGIPYNGMVGTPYSAPIHPGYPMNNPPFVPFTNEPTSAHETNGIVNGDGYTYGAPSQLSAEVPDFSPSQLNVNGAEFVPGKGIQKDGQASGPIYNEPPASVVNGNEFIPGRSFQGDGLASGMFHDEPPASIVNGNGPHVNGVHSQDAGES